MKQRTVLEAPGNPRTVICTAPTVASRPGRGRGNRVSGAFTVDELSHTLDPHPTLNDVLPEAAKAVYGRALNV